VASGCTEHADDGLERCVGWGILASNLRHIGQHLALTRSGLHHRAPRRTRQSQQGTHPRLLLRRREALRQRHRLAPHVLHEPDRPQERAQDQKMAPAGSGTTT
jgi:hypothetical protein